MPSTKLLCVGLLSLTYLVAYAKYERILQGQSYFLIPYWVQTAIKVIPELKLIVETVVRLV